MSTNIEGEVFYISISEKGYYMYMIDKKIAFKEKEGVVDDETKTIEKDDKVSNSIKFRSELRVLLNLEIEFELYYRRLLVFGPNCLQD